MFPRFTVKHVNVFFIFRVSLLDRMTNYSVVISIHAGASEMSHKDMNESFGTACVPILIIIFKEFFCI